MTPAAINPSRRVKFQKSLRKVVMRRLSVLGGVAAVRAHHTEKSAPAPLTHPASRCRIPASSLPHAGIEKHEERQRERETETIKIVMWRPYCAALGINPMQAKPE